MSLTQTADEGTEAGEIADRMNLVHSWILVAGFCCLAAVYGGYSLANRLYGHSAFVSVTSVLVSLIAVTLIAAPLFRALGRKYGLYEDQLTAMGREDLVRG